MRDPRPLSVPAAGVWIPPAELKEWRQAAPMLCSRPISVRERMRSAVELGEVARHAAKVQWKKCSAAPSMRCSRRGPASARCVRIEHGRVTVRGDLVAPAVLHRRPVHSPQLPAQPVHALKDGHRSTQALTAAAVQSTAAKLSH